MESTIAPNLFTKKQVLLVEDDNDIKLLLRELLEAEGYVTVCATNGQEALDILRNLEVPPALILLDLMMPVKDGFQFRQEQVQNPRLAEIPVVIMSADSRVEKRCMKMGVEEWLRKPVDIDVFLATVRRYCAKAI